MIGRDKWREARSDTEGEGRMQEMKSRKDNKYKKNEVKSDEKIQKWQKRVTVRT